MAMYVTFLLYEVYYRIIVKNIEIKLENGSFPVLSC